MTATKTILILSANPKDTARLRLDEEVRGICEGLERSKHRDQFIIHQVWAIRLRDIRRAVLDNEPQIVHFCGHGEDGGEEGLIFEDETGHSKVVNTKALAGFFELFANRIECVVLNACYSEIQAEAIARHIGFVIGMKKGVGDKAAIEFAVAFYDALGAGASIEFAFRVACNAIQWTQSSDQLIPVLKKTHCDNCKNPRHLQTSGRITEPKAKEMVGRRIKIQGKLENIQTDDHFWIAGKIGKLFWPKEPVLPNPDGTFAVTIYEYGNPPKGIFSIVLLQASSEGNEYIKNWYKQGHRTGSYPGIRIPDVTELDLVDVRL